MVGGYVIVDGRELMETLSHSCRHRQRKWSLSRYL
jgi:hypothetical protein